MGALRTESVFKAGRPTYLRFTQFTKDRMVSVECFGVTNPGHCLNLAWLQPAGGTSSPPKPGAKVQINSLFDGVLHIVRGKVMDVSTGSKPRIRVKVEENCLAVALRKHQRHLVTGKVRLGQEGDVNSYNQITPHELDISLGGFGLTIPDNGCKQGDEIEFSLELLGETADASTGEEGISYQFSGMAIVRRASIIEHSKSIQLGFQFLKLSQEAQHGLEHWFAVQGSVQRIG